MSNAFETQGMFSWFELITNDVNSATQFYGEILGWQFQQDSNNPNYTLVRTNPLENPIAGILDKKAILCDDKNVPNHWGCYITVTNIEESISKVENLGGKIIVPCTNIPKVGIFAVIQDPTGAIISLMEYKLEI